MLRLPFDEYRIVTALLADARCAGLLVSVFDGEEWALAPTPDYDAARRVIGATDETRLRFRDPATCDANGKAAVVGDVFLIHGNGEDVIADCSDNPATLALVARALRVAGQAA